MKTHRSSSSFGFHPRLGLLSLVACCLSPFLRADGAPTSVAPVYPPVVDGPAASVTILPVMMGGHPNDRVAEVIGLLLEKQGMQNLELGPRPFLAGIGRDMESLTQALGSFVKEPPLATRYCLYCEATGGPQTGVTGLREVVVDATGATVWAKQQASSDPGFAKHPIRDPMAAAQLLVEWLKPAFQFTPATEKAAQPGKFARLMDARSGLPPQAERDAIPPRRQALPAMAPTATLLVLPVIVADRSETAIAARIAQRINDARFFRFASTPGGGIALPAALPDPNELKVLWDLARALQDYVRKNPPAADYVLAADYRFSANNWEQGYLHVVACDRQGNWVIVDLLNSHHKAYQDVKPTSPEGCEKLLLDRLGYFLRRTSKGTSAQPG